MRGRLCEDLPRLRCFAIYGLLRDSVCLIWLCLSGLIELHSCEIYPLRCEWGLRRCLSYPQEAKLLLVECLSSSNLVPHSNQGQSGAPPKLLCHSPQLLLPLSHHHSAQLPQQSHCQLGFLLKLRSHPKTTGSTRRAQIDQTTNFLGQPGDSKTRCVATAARLAIQISERFFT